MHSLKFLALPLVALAVALPNARLGLGGVKVNARETVEEAALRARELAKFRSDGIGTLMSVYPADFGDQSLAGQPVGLQEYFAVTDDGDFYLLAMPISRTYAFALGTTGKNISLSIKDEKSEREKGKLWAASRPRLEAYGYLEVLGTDNVAAKEAEDVYVAEHPDAKYWLPHVGPHHAFWVKLHVEKVYFVGGFGDRAQITWFPLDLWKSSVPKEDNFEDAARLMIQSNN